MISTPRRRASRHEGGAGADEAFLVGQRDPPARLQGCVRWAQAGGPADRGKDDIGLPPDRFEYGGLRLPRSRSRCRTMRL